MVHCKFSQKLQQPYSHEKTMSEPIPSMGLPRRPPNISEVPTGSGGSLDHLRGLPPLTLHLLTFLKLKKRWPTRRRLSSPSPPLSHPPSLSSSLDLWPPPRLGMNSTAHPKDLAHDSILLYASQMVYPLLAGFAANYCW